MLSPRSAKSFLLISSLNSRQSSSNTVVSSENHLKQTVQTSIFNFMKRYEDIIGISAVKEAQQGVIEAENAFANSQEARRTKQTEIKQLQYRLKDIHGELDKTSRGEDRYLNLLTEEHRIIKEERQLLEQFQFLEDEERRRFHGLSACLRESHEKERERGERTKYWSIIGSVFGATIGILGTTVNNRLRMGELRRLVGDSGDNPVRIRAVLQELTGLVHTQQEQVGNFIGEIKSILDPDFMERTNLLLNGTDNGRSAVEATAKNVTNFNENGLNYPILSALREHNEKLDKNLEILKQMIASQRGTGDSEEKPVVFYTDSEIGNLLSQTERKIESKITRQTLLNFVLVYSALAITIPIISVIFRGAGSFSF